MGDLLVGRDNGGGSSNSSEGGELHFEGWLTGRAKNE